MHCTYNLHALRGEFGPQCLHSLGCQNEAECMMRQIEHCSGARAM
jgi:hypothetical protein